jgi:hypothetical protein
MSTLTSTFDNGPIDAAAELSTPPGGQVGAVYPTDNSVNHEVLDDLNSKEPLISDEQIITKLLALPDLHLGLWGPEGIDVEMPRYVALHHAASRGRTDLLQFILANRSVPEQVNIANRNHYTALRYAHRSRLPSIIAILEKAGAVEDYPSLMITCSGRFCDTQFEVPSNERAKFAALNFTTPKYCQPCRAARRAQGGNARNDRGAQGGNARNDRGAQGGDTRSDRDGQWRAR